jgi:hypothetical protein
MIYDDGVLYTASTDGTLAIVDADSLRIITSKKFNGCSFKHIQLIASTLYALVNFAGYTGDHIQDYSVAGEDFTPINEPIYCGTVVRGTDGNIYGAKITANIGSSLWISGHTPVTGDIWDTAWELLPADYPYYIYPNMSMVQDADPNEKTRGGEVINFYRTNDVFIINSGPTSSFLAYTSMIHRMKFTGQHDFTYNSNTIIGPNELVKSPLTDEWALLRCTGAFTNLSLSVIGNFTADFLVATLITGLEISGVPQDNSLYHRRTIWHSNDRIYSCHHTYSEFYLRIISVDPGGTLIDQYDVPIPDGTHASFVSL